MRMKARMILLICIIGCVMCMMGCQTQKSNPQSIHGGNDIPVYPGQEEDRDSAQAQSNAQKQTEGKGIVVEVDSNSRTCTILLLDTSEKVVYSYNGGTEVFDRHEEPLSMAQLQLGEIVEYEYVKDGKRLTKISEWSEAWEYLSATKLTIDEEKQVLYVGEEEYTFTDELIVVQDGRLGSLDKLEAVDVVTLKGRKKQLDSMIVTQGHGYIRLDSTGYFEGGYVDLGADYVAVITENMRIPMSAGTYIMTVTKNDTKGSKEISVEENEEIRVNLTDFQEEAVRYGSVQFKIEPAGAILKIDGKETAYSGLVDVTYGNHSIEVRKDGYGTYTQTIVVNSILSEYDITLLEEETTTTKEAATEAESHTTEAESHTTEAVTTSKWTHKEEETTTYNAESAWYGILSGILDD